MEALQLSWSREGPPLSSLSLPSLAFVSCLSRTVGFGEDKRGGRDVRRTDAGDDMGLLLSLFVSGARDGEDLLALDGRLRPDFEPGEAPLEVVPLPLSEGDSDGFEGSCNFVLFRDKRENLETGDFFVFSSTGDLFVLSDESGDLVPDTLASLVTL